MKQNMGIIDRIVRIVLAAAVAALYFTHQLSATAGVVLGILAIVFVVTSVVGVCPLYLAIRLSTKRRPAA